MTLDEAKQSAKEGIVQQMNDYIGEQLPYAALLHALVWRVNTIADGRTPTTDTEAVMQSIFNFVVLLQQAAQPFFALIDAATTVDGVWATAGGFNPRAVPPPAAAQLRLYSTRLERLPVDPT